MLSFTKTQIEAVFFLLLRQQNDLEISRNTGYPLHLVRFIIKANKKKFADRIRFHKKLIESKVRPIKDAEDMQCREMIDAIREILGKRPLYAFEKESSEKRKEQARHRWHTKVKLQKLKTEQANIIKDKLI